MVTINSTRYVFLFSSKTCDLTLSGRIWRRGCFGRTFLTVCVLQRVVIILVSAFVAFFLFNNLDMCILDVLVGS